VAEWLKRCLTQTLVSFDLTINQLYLYSILYYTFYKIISNDAVFYGEMLQRVGLCDTLSTMTSITSALGLADDS